MAVDNVTHTRAAVRRFVGHDDMRLRWSTDSVRHVADIKADCWHHRVWRANFRATPGAYGEDGPTPSRRARALLLSPATNSRAVVFPTPLVELLKLKKNRIRSPRESNGIGTDRPIFDVETAIMWNLVLNQSIVFWNL